MFSTTEGREEWGSRRAKDFKSIAKTSWRFLSPSPSGTISARNLMCDWKVVVRRDYIKDSSWLNHNNDGQNHAHLALHPPVYSLCSSAKVLASVYASLDRQSLLHHIPFVYVFGVLR